ncbi:uncharacterized protein A1O9_12591 [Exophiala aquamarina CBS 119918]|uniref:AB hydrolase-1 domain-containing protein n=1 Tax=Exophiala aquamarina CBS 119918 TaxID=1182545 RepID=A0A072NVM0_9EURO|nr:uncharacterized protein A1O9_12591 [Exophiala aquamarina CBS 119918]KEF51442.1 hypothetical protein A1O9_12591 [Exophiala aquamarina CBS 119918]
MKANGLPARDYRRTLHYIKAFTPRRADTVRSVDEDLKLAVNEYRCQASHANAWTLVFTHGTSFNKDLWHAIIHGILTSDALQGHIERVLAIDAANHGDSAVANERFLGPATHWPDHSRDILAVLQHFKADRNVIGIGHSFGGGTMCHAASMAPFCFKETILIEPILFQMDSGVLVLAQATLKKRDEWPSLEHVSAAFSKSAGLANWDPRQRDLYAETGTYDKVVDGGTVRTLKTTKYQEAATYRAKPFPAILDLLRDSPSKLEFIFGGSSKVLSSSQRAQIKGLVGANGTISIIGDAGHLIPMTHPQILTDMLVQMLTRTICCDDCRLGMTKL